VFQLESIMQTSIPIKVFFVQLLFFFNLFANTGCENRSFGQRADSLFLVGDEDDILYDLKKPSEKYLLPYVLEEISGLTYVKNGRVLAIDDETGKVFEYNLNTKEIIHSIKFHKPDDYEGIEYVNDTVYILRSDGDIFSFPYTEEKEVDADKIETKLSGKNDTEGLGYNPETGNLLIACKEKGEIGEDIKGKARAIYHYDIKREKVKKDPFSVISAKRLEKFWESKKDFDYETDRIKFKPSGIAFNPIDKNFYIIASIGKLLVVVNANGEIVNTYPLYPGLLGQPEGICFNEQGDLFISSEGEGDRGYILKFPIKK